MICPYCGTKNNRHANVCKKCGKSLNPIATMKKEHLNAHNPNYYDDEVENKSSGKALIIVFLSVILCVTIIMSSVFFIAQDIHKQQSIHNNSSSKNSTNFTNDSINQNIPYVDDNENIDNDTDIYDSNDEDDNEDTSSEYDDIKILNGSFDNGNKLPTKPKCTINVGEEYAGKKLKIQVAYSCDSDPLNDGRIIPKTVDSNGEISLKSKKSFKEYPDLAIITIYDSEDNILDQTEISLSANTGIQVF